MGLLNWEWTRSASTITSTVACSPPDNDAILFDDPGKILPTVANLDGERVRLRLHCVVTDSGLYAHSAILNMLDYFCAVRCTPPDCMHAVHLGLNKRFWHKFLINACNDMRDETGPRLSAAQAVIESAILPTHMKKPFRKSATEAAGCRRPK